MTIYMQLIGTNDKPEFSLNQLDGLYKRIALCLIFFIRKITVQLTDFNILNQSFVYSLELVVCSFA